MQSETSALLSTTAPKSVRTSGPIQCVPLANALAAFMPIAVILTIGVDLFLSGSQSKAWQSAGYRVTPVGSIRDAIDYIRYGDFDLVLMGDSIRPADRERLTFLIRASGSRVPVVCVTASASDCAPFADATVTSEPDKLLRCTAEVLAVRAGKPAANSAMPSGRLLSA